MALPGAFPFRRPELVFSLMWDELLLDAKGDARLATSPHLPLQHLMALFATVLLSYQVRHLFSQCCHAFQGPLGMLACYLGSSQDSVKR